MWELCSIRSYRKIALRMPSFLLFQSVRRSLIVIRLKMRRTSSLLNVTEPIDQVWQNAQDLKFKSKTGSSLLLADCSNNWVRRALAKNWLRRNWCSDRVVNRHLTSFYGLPLYFKSESSVPVIGFNKVLSVTLHYVWKRPFLGQISLYQVTQIHIGLNLCHLAPIRLIAVTRRRLIASL